MCLSTGRVRCYIGRMINELAHFALILGFVVAIAQTVIPLVGAHKGWRGWMHGATTMALRNWS